MYEIGLMWESDYFLYFIIGWYKIIQVNTEIKIFITFILMPWHQLRVKLLTDDGMF